MAWTQEHKQTSRSRILIAAAELFTRKGFKQVGIDEIMQAAGMTRGAFYAHFESKAQLFEEAIEYAGQRAAVHFSQGQAPLSKVIDNYLSNEHLLSGDIRCPIACLVSDMAHCDERVRHTYTKVFKGLVRHLRSLNPGQRDSQSEHSALLQTILLVGGMAIARSLSDQTLAEQVLEISSTTAKDAARAREPVDPGILSRLET